MCVEKFKRDFKRLNGVYATDNVVLLRNPLELYSLATGKTVATFKTLDETLAFEIDGKTLEQLSAGAVPRSPFAAGGSAHNLPYSRCVCECALLFNPF